MPPTVSVLCRAYDQNGLPVNGAVFFACLSVTEIYNGFVVPEAVEATVGSDGTCVLNLWPNVLGVTGSHYKIGGWNPDTGRWFLKGTATIPNSACNLEDVLSLESLDSIDTSTLKSVLETSALVLASRDTAQAAALSASASLSQAEAAAAAAAASAADSGVIESVRQEWTATEGQTAFVLTLFTYVPTANNLAVYVNGLRQDAGTAYTETSNTTFTFTEGLKAGDVVHAFSNESVDSTAVAQLLADLASHASGKGDSLVASDDGNGGSLWSTVAGFVSFFRTSASAVVSRVNLLAGSATNLLIRDKSAGATRVHIEPNGVVTSGTTAKLDWMFDPYQADPENYRIVNIYTKNGDGYGQNGVGVLGVKAVGDQWGVWPSLNIGFSDDGASGVPMKVVLFDTSDTEWRTPMKGAWQSGATYSANDYVLAGFKLYKAVGGGVAGATKPAHATGTVTDGAISWEFIRNYQANLDFIEPSVIFGNRDDAPMFGHSGCRVQYLRHTVHKPGFRDKWLKASGALLAWVGARTDSDSYQIEMDDGSRFQFFAGWSRQVNAARALSATTLTSNSATPSVATLEKLVLSNTAPTTITSFSGGRGSQIIYVESTNTNTTIAHGTNIRTKTAANIAMTTDMLLCFVQRSDGAWVQV